MGLFSIIGKALSKAQSGALDALEAGVKGTIGRFTRVAKRAPLDINDVADPTIMPASIRKQMKDLKPDAMNLSDAEEQFTNARKLLDDMPSPWAKKRAASALMDKTRQLKNSKQYKMATESGEISEYNKIINANEKAVRQSLYGFKGTLRPLNALSICFEYPQACATVGVLAAAGTPAALLATNFMKCKKFTVAPNGCSDPSAEDDLTEENEEVAKALAGFDEQELSCFFTCMPLNYPEPEHVATPEYNTAEAVTEVATGELSNNNELTQSAAADLADEEFGPAANQPYCTSEQDLSYGGCDNFCSRQCTNIGMMELGPPPEEGDLHGNTSVGIAIAAIVAALVGVFLVMAWFRRRNELTDEEEEIIREFEDDD